MSSNAPWKFRRRQGWCSGCERPFAEGERHFSALVVQAGELLRVDACESCWQDRGLALANAAAHVAEDQAHEVRGETAGTAAPHDPPNADRSHEDAHEVAHEQAQAHASDELFWWATRHQPGKRTTLALDLEALEALFLRLHEREETAIRELNFVLALLLMRKRRLKLERVERKGAGEAMVFRRPRREELYRVSVFDFDAEKMEELRTRLAEVLEGAADDEDPTVAARTGDSVESTAAGSAEDAEVSVELGSEG